MALTEKIEIDRIEVVQQWNIQVRQATTIEKDGVFVSKTFHRWVLNPDSDITNQEQKFKIFATQHGHQKLEVLMKHLKLNKLIDLYNE
jgi:hypothetical protein